MFVAGLTLHASAGEDFLVATPSGLPSHADAAFSPLQYYEMSYGLNIEMHKQVSLGGTGALSWVPCPWSPVPTSPCGPFGVIPSNGKRGRLLPAVVQGSLCLWGTCSLLCALGALPRSASQPWPLFSALCTRVCALA